MTKLRQLWAGRFSEQPDALANIFNASVDVDTVMALEDIDGSVAHATMLGEQGILPAVEVEQIIAGLRELREDVRAGRVEWLLEDEDVHMNLERMLTERIGPVGGKLHTARSRNDQVATDLRLWLRGASHAIIDQIQALREVLVDLAEEHLDVIMPGYTHLQVAQPVRFAHHMLAYYEMLSRDHARFTDGLPRLNISPLGAGALAGTGFAIDRHRTASLLGFNGPARNSLDAVSDRDFALEFLFNAALTTVHLSRLSEELIVWSSQEFGFITLPDSHTTGSSIMPQKKNPDVCELIRGKTGRMTGHLMALFMVMKALPLAYNKDMQEDKEGVFDAARTLRVMLELYATMLPRMMVHADRMQEAAGAAFSNATDLADYLAARGMPFREAHEVVGRLVALCLNEGLGLGDLPLARMREVSELIDEDVFAALDTEQVVNARTSYGGTARATVEGQIAAARAALSG